MRNDLAYYALRITPGADSPDASFANLHQPLKQSYGGRTHADTDEDLTQSRESRQGFFASFALCVLAALREIDLQSSPNVSSSPNMMFMFCTAWPLAPFSRLSSLAVMIHSPGRGRGVTPMATRLVFTV